jgi:hypothetical protein
LHYFIAIQGLEVGFECIMSSLSGLKHIENGVVGKGWIDVEQSPAQLLLALDIVALFIVQSQNIVEFQLEDLVLRPSLIRKAKH